MIRAAVLLASAITLSACATAPTPLAPQVTIAGPKFPRSQFDCGGKPLPPDPSGATQKAAAIYEQRLGNWGEDCQGKLATVGQTLEGAGQVEPKGNGVP